MSTRFHKMPHLEIANTNFEWELSEKKPCDLAPSFLIHRNFLQLQFLALFYTDPNSSILVSYPPDENYFATLKTLGFPKETLPNLITLSDSFSYEIQSWGYSQNIARWATQKNLSYDIPSWELIKKLASKEFVYSMTDRLIGSELLKTEDAVKKWLRQPFFPKVLKTCYGFSGRGHMLIDNSEFGKNERLYRFIYESLKNGYPLIGEPWVNRVSDFSTQWYISKNKELMPLGITKLQVDGRGVHVKNATASPEQIFNPYPDFLERHLRTTYLVLKKMADMGYFGFAGVDGFIYQENGEIKLQSISEINLRKTFGFVTLEMRRRFFPDKNISLSYVSQKEGLLPQALRMGSGKKISFPKQLILEVHHGNDKN